MTDLSKYAYCEPTCAGSLAPYCIRRLTAAGPKYSGGVDSDSLCGRVSARNFGGWDIERLVHADDFEVSTHRNRMMVCQRCVEKLREAGEGA